MKMIDLIQKKKNGEPLSKDEIDFFIKGVTADNIPDYQTAALLMAICLKGMNGAETLALTDAMIHSGDILEPFHMDEIVCDKHSTGGVADTVTLILAPMLAATNGCAVAKMSGRGLGHTGGTVDKLESIHNFNVDIPLTQFVKNVKKNKIAVISQLDNICPADKKLYALRDVTGTVDSIPLIAASIMSKKIACGADNIFLDVKCGNGAFMPDIASAEVLANTLVDIGYNYGKSTIAVITDMNAPLGDYIGNSMEVYEALEILSGRTKNKLSYMCIEIYALIISKIHNISMSEARDRGERLLYGGHEAYDKFVLLVQNQGGDIDCLNKDYLINTKNVLKIVAKENGYISTVNALALGQLFVELGGGRTQKGEKIDYNVGIKLEVHTGERVEVGDTLFYIYYNDKLPKNIDSENYITIVDNKVQLLPLIYKIIGR